MSSAIQGWQWCSSPIQRWPSRSWGPFDFKSAMEHWPSGTDARQSAEKPLFEAEIFQYWLCLTNTSFISPRYPKSCGTSYYTTIVIIAEIFRKISTIYSMYLKVAQLKLGAFWPQVCHGALTIRHRCQIVCWKTFARSRDLSVLTVLKKHVFYFSKIPEVTWYELLYNNSNNCWDFQENLHNL